MSGDALRADMSGGPMSEVARRAYGEEALIATFRGMVYRMRTEAGLSERQLAKLMGVSTSAVRQMEDGGTRPTPELLAKLGIAVGQELDWDETFGSDRLLNPLGRLDSAR